MTTPIMTPPPPPPPPAAQTKRRRRQWLVVALAVGALVVLTVAALTAVAWLARDVDSRSTSIEPVSAIQFRGDAAGFELVEADRDDVRVDTELTSSPWRDPVVETEIVDGVLVVTSDCPDFLTFSCSTDTVLTVPQGSLDELDIEVDAGAVRIEGSSASVIATSQAGRIELVDHRGTSATLRTQAGRVEVDATVPPAHLDVQVQAGTIDITLPDADYDLDATTDLGIAATSVRQLDGAPHRVIARADVGDVDVHMR